MKSIGIFSVAAILLCVGSVCVWADPVVEGFSQTTDRVFSGDYESGFTDTVKMPAGVDRPDDNIILTYEVDIDEGDIFFNDRVTNIVRVTVGHRDWQMVGNRWQVDVSGSSEFIKVQDFWTGEYDFGTVSRVFDADDIDVDSSGVISNVESALGHLASVDAGFAGSAVFVSDRGDYDNDGLNIVEFNNSTAYFSDIDGKVMDTEYDLVRLVYDNGDDPYIDVGYLSPGHSTFFLLDMENLFGTGKVFDISHFFGVALGVSGNRDDDTPDYNDEAGVIVETSLLVYEYDAVSSIPIQPGGIHLYPAVPNPFNPNTTITYSIDKPCDVLLVVYDVSGRKINTLVSGYESAGLKSVVWDGTNSSGMRVASGVYFHRLVTDHGSRTGKAILAK